MVVLRAAILLVAHSNLLPPELNDVKKPDLYVVLGVSKDAGHEQIKKAHRKLAMKHHPDQGGDPVAFRAISAAWKVLSNPEAKKYYDETGEIPEERLETVPGLLALCQIFEQALQAEGENIFQIDIMKAIKDTLEGAIEKESGMLDAVDAKIKHLQKVAKRLKRTKDTQPYLENVIERKIDGMRRAKETAPQRVADLEAALELAENYTFRKDKRQDSGSDFSPWHNMGTTASSFTFR